MSAARPRVALDVTPLLGFRTGIGLSVQETWAALSALGDGPTLIPYALGLRARTGSDGLPAGIRVVRLPTRALLAAWSRRDVPRLDLWLADADVVHATNFVVAPSRHPTLVTVNDIGFVLDPGSANAVVATFPAVLRRAIARGAHVHVTTEHVAAEVEEHFGPGLVAAGRISVVPFGIPALGPKGSVSPAVAGRLAGRPYVLAVGSQERRKNLPRLVGAFARVADRRSDLALVLVGAEGPDTPAVRDAVARLPREVGERVVLAGPVGPGARRALLEGAALLAYPSLYEGFGFPPLEAMTVGVPVVAARVGAVVEVAGGAAELADPADVDDLAAALERVLSDPDLRARLVGAGRARTSAFSWERTARGLASVYARLASSS